MPVSYQKNRLFYCAIAAGREVGNSISPAEGEQKMLYVFGRLINSLHFGGFETIRLFGRHGWWWSEWRNQPTYFKQM